MVSGGSACAGVSPRTEGTLLPRVPPMVPAAAAFYQVLVWPCEDRALGGQYGSQPGDASKADQLRPMVFLMAIRAV